MNRIAAIRNIPNAVRAQLSGSVSQSNILFNNVFKSVRAVNHLEIPTARFQFTTLSDDQEATIRSYGLSKVAGKAFLFEGSPSAANLPLILAYGTIKSQFHPGTVPSDAYVSYIYALKGLRMFSAVMQGAHFSDTLVYAEGLKILPNGPVEVEHMAEKAMLEFNNVATDMFSISSGRAKILSYAWSATKTLEFGDYVSPGSKEIAFHSPGIFFPYFRGMNLPDKSAIGHVFQRLFMRGLADTPEQAANLMNRLRSGFRALATSEAGMALAHAYTGVELAETACCGFQVVAEAGVYLGFILLGDIVVQLFSNIVPAVNEAGLLAELGKTNIHGKALADFLAAIRTPSLESGNVKYDWTVEMISSPRKLVQMVQSVEFSDFTEEQMASMEKAVDNMRFSEVFPQVNYKTILDFINFVSTGDHQYLQQYPAYLQEKYWKHSSKVAVGLGMFGPSAPSMNYGTVKEQSFTIPSLQSEDPNTVIGQSGKRSLAFLPFSIVPINVARQQWSSLFNTGKFYLPSGRSNKNEFTHSGRYNIQIGGTPEFATLYQKIKEHVSITRESLRGEKRRNRDGDVEAKPSAKRMKELSIADAAIM
jgi:hypothetical protein